ncbi:unnamed protein product [Leptosia nina]|uniref:Uncharacterized protein n=1 Tax=Leptosia nina TaxID=320188 RepID=A0AAV1JWK7_9NEOP
MSFMKIDCYLSKKSTLPKYDPPYVKKPIAKSFAGGSTTSNNSQEDISLETGKIHSFNNTFRDHKQMKRVHSGSEDEPTHSGEEDIAFIDVTPGNMSKLPEKGILKKHGYGAIDGKDKWGDDSQSEHLEAGSQSDGQEPSGAVADMEYKFKDLNGYHENIIEALKTAAAQRASSGVAGGSGDLRALQEYEYKRERAPSAEKIHEAELRRQRGEEEEDDQRPCGPYRIRNLEDLIRQLEHHSSRHMSPSGSEDIRMAETDPDRHYRIEDVPPRSADSRCRGRLPPGEEESRFGYRGFRGSGRHHGSMFAPAPAPGLLAHAHAPHAPHAPHAHAPHRVPPDDDALYETADTERLRDAPDSESDRAVEKYASSRFGWNRLRSPFGAAERALRSSSLSFSSDEFIQAQQQLARWASEETVPVREYYPSPAGSSASDRPGAFPDQALTVESELDEPRRVAEKAGTRPRRVVRPAIVPNHLSDKQPDFADPGRPFGFESSEAPTSL